MEELFLPTLHWFAMNNSFSGSCGALRYMIRPNVMKMGNKEVDMEQSSIICEYWHGLYCYEMSEMEGQQSFPMSEEGLMAIRKWLQSVI